MQAFHNDPAIKDKYLARVAAHRVADELIKGQGWQDGKGCAIGCLFEYYDHGRAAKEWDVPEMILRLADCMFEGLPNGKSQEWPERLTSAIKPGTDLSRVGWQFLHWLITRSGIGAYDHPLVKDAVAQVAEVLRAPAEGRPIDISAAWSARSAAESAAESAWSAAESAAESAAWSARSAAWSARSAAYIAMADQLILLLEAA